MQGTYFTVTDSSGPVGNLIMDAGVFEYGIGLIRVLFSNQSDFKISLVTKVDFVVSLIHLKCALGCYISIFLVPIITNNNAHFSACYKPSR